ncbi:MAG: hypothetical protein LC808_20635 [Actinobacteria bacterium]|nr:hypothetical protein [Actinomycetota bacterium]
MLPMVRMTVRSLTVVTRGSLVIPVGRHEGGGSGEVVRGMVAGTTRT